MTDLPDFSPVTERVAALLDAIDDTDLTRPTPCDYDVATLLDHLGGLALAFTLAARKSDDPSLRAAPSPTGSSLDPEWRTTIPSRLADLVEAWRDPEAWSGSTVAGGVELPGDVAGVVALNEVTIHGWDLAVATGQSYDVDDDTLAIVEDFAEQTFAAPPEEREGLFGPPLPVPEGASRFARVLALDGRDPSWSA